MIPSLDRVKIPYQLCSLPVLLVLFTFGCSDEHGEDELQTAFLGAY